MPNDYQYIELSFINDYNEIKRQIINTVAITYLLQEGYEPTSLNCYLESTQYGYNASAKPEGKHLLTRITDINAGAVNWDNVPYCDCDDVEKYLLKKHDILIARTGGTTGKTYLINEVPANAIFASYLIRLRANKKCLPEFMNIFLNSYVFWSQISELKSGSAQPNVNAEKLKTLSIPDCPIAVQRKVVAIINDIDVEDDLFSLELKEKINIVLSVFDSNEEIKNELDRQQTYLQLLRQTILQEAVQGKLTKQDPTDEPANELLKRIKAEKEKLIKAGKLKKGKELPPITEVEIPFELPEGWVWCRFEEIKANRPNSLKAGPFGSALKKEDYSNTGYKIYGQEQVIANDHTIGDYYINEKKFAILKSCEVSPGDILVSLVGTIGRILVLPDNIEKGIINPRLVKLSLYPEINREFIRFIFQSPYLMDYLKEISHGGTMNILNLGLLKGLFIPLPPFAEQQRIVAKVQQLQQQLSQLEAQVQLSKQYAQQLLQSVLREAFEGKGKVYKMEEKVSMVAES